MKHEGTIFNEQLQSIINKINSFKDLKKNWDGYLSNIINEQIIQLAKEDIKFISYLFYNLNLSPRQDIHKIYPSVVPVPKGNIQFEWEYNNKYLEIELGTDNKYHILKIDYLSKDEKEYTVKTFQECLYFIYWILNKHPSEII